MSKVEESAASLESRDWSSAVVEERPRSVSVVHSVRMPADLTERLAAEAERRGITPSDLIRELVRAGLDETDEAQSVVINVAELHRVIEAAIHNVARRAA